MKQIITIICIRKSIVKINHTKQSENYRSSTVSVDEQTLENHCNKDAIRDYDEFLLSIFC